MILKLSRTDKLLNVRVYKLNSRNAVVIKSLTFVGLSKILTYEKPYNVIGIIKRTGLKVAPKDICTDRFVGTWEATNMERLTLNEMLGWKERNL